MNHGDYSSAVSCLVQIKRQSIISLCRTFLYQTWAANKNNESKCQDVRWMSSQWSWSSEQWFNQCISLVQMTAHQNTHSKTPCSRTTSASTQHWAGSTSGAIRRRPQPEFGRLRCWTASAESYYYYYNWYYDHFRNYAYNSGRPNLKLGIVCIFKFRQILQFPSNILKHSLSLHFLQSGFPW